MNSFFLKTILLPSIWACGAAAGSAIYLNAGKRHILPGACLGAVSWFVYLLIKLHTHSEAQANFLGAFAVALCAELLAIFTKTPATVFLVPGIIPLVPGAGIFSMMRAVVEREGDQALSTGYNTFIAATAIALGVAMASSITRMTSLGRKNNQLLS